jgi:uncharacterized protein (TIGR03083 family)
MSTPDLLTLAEQERTDLLTLLLGLSDEQWNAPSLCTRWSVRDVALHVVSYDELSTVDLVGSFLRGAVRLTPVNHVVLDRYRGLEPREVVRLVSRHTRPRGLTASFRGGIALTDGTIHQQDIRRSLDLPRTIPPERLVPVLDFALGAPRLPARKNSKGLRLVATDLEWTAGAGPEVTGSGEALLMAITGRRQALGELDGPGLPTLRRRVA